MFPEHIILSGHYIIWQPGLVTCCWFWYDT